MYQLQPQITDKDSLLKVWGQCLTEGKTNDANDAVVAELAEYFHLSLDEARKHAINWETDSLKEWALKDRSNYEGLVDFYQTQNSWIFDTMWYHANQHKGEAPAESVEIAYGLKHLKPGKHLDFGAGPGSSGLFFHALGWDVSLADISTTMLNFARWRLQKHNVPATFYDTTKDKFPDQTFDLITAFDVMVHVPNIEETLNQLYRALKPGGYLVFNIDNQPLTPTTQWNLYRDQYPILKQVRKYGFRRHQKIIYFHVYQKVERSKLNTALIGVFDLMRYNGIVTFIGNQVRTLKRLVTNIAKYSPLQKG